MDHFYLMYGLGSDLDTVRGLLFSQGQQGGIWVPSWSDSMIAGNTFGTGVHNLLDLSNRGNLFSQASSGNRPAWFVEPKRGRVNLFTNTENFNSSWVLTRMSVGGKSLSPNGSLTADKIIPTDVAGTHVIGQVAAGPLPACISFYAKAAGYFIFRINANTSANGFAEFNLQTGVISATGGTGFVSADMANYGDGWYRCSLTLSTETSTVRQILIQDESAALSFTGDNEKGILLWGAQVEGGTSPTNYQKVASAFEVTEMGQANCYGVRFDGTDDWMQTASVNWGSDKVTWFVGIRRRSVAARGTVLELTASIDSNNGAFHLTAPNAASSTFGFESKGTTLRDAIITQALGPPKIITAIGDISGDLTSIQIDNGTPTTNTGDQGSGNYANSVLYLGRRGGSTLALTGDIFAIIGVNELVTASVAATVRTIMSKVVPIVSL
jgi:hypothetical protein